MVSWKSFLVASILVVAVTSFSVPANEGSNSLLHSVARRSAGNSTCGTHRRALTESNQQQEYKPVASNRRSSDISYYSLLFPFCCLGVGFICNVLLAHYAAWMPYTVFIMVVGLLVGLLHRGTDNGLGVLSDSIEAWDHIDPHLLLFAFIPPLLFGDSMSLNFHHVKACFWQCFVLAGPGVCIGTGLMALVAKWVLPYSWDWKMSFCFASITAATDPVAVVGLLNSLGASKKLTMVIAGESLMNDGIAIVIFTLFKNLLHGQSYDFWGVLEFLFQVALGGPAVGLAFGLVAIGVLIIIKNSTEGKEADNLSNQTTLTFVVAYLSFFVGEEVCEVSGVLACVVCGVCIAAYGTPLLSSIHDIHHVWHVVEFMGNTIVFMLSGIIIASDIYDSYELDKTKTGKYFGYMVVVYLFMVLIRTVMMAILYVPLDNLGYGLERKWKDAVIGVWGGLRGAIGLILCLIIDEDSTICNDGAPFVVLIGGATFYTLAINGVTTGPLLEALGMLKDKDAQKFLDFSVHRRIHKKTREEFDRLTDPEKHPEHKDAEKKPAMTLIKILGDTWTETNKEGKKSLTNLLVKANANEAKRDSEELTGNSVKEMFRMLYLEMVRSEYSKMIEHQVIPVTSSVPNSLLASIEMALDETDIEKEKMQNEEGKEKEYWMKDWDHIKGQLPIGWYHNIFDNKPWAVQIMHLNGRLVAKDRNAYLLHSYQRAHELAWQAFEKHLNGTQKDEVKNGVLVSGALKNKDGVAHAKRRKDGVYAMCRAVEKEENMTGLFTKYIEDARDDVRIAHQYNMRKCVEELDKDETKYNDDGDNKTTIMGVLATKLLAAETLQFQRTRLQAAKGSAVLSPKGYDSMLAEIEQNIHTIQVDNIVSTATNKDFMKASKGTLVTASMANVVAPAAELNAVSSDPGAQPEEAQL